MNSIWQLHVEPEPLPEATRLASGIWVPEVSDSYDYGQRNERNELRPLHGVVLSSPANGYWTMYDDAGYSKSRFSQAHGVQVLTDAGRMSIILDANGNQVSKMKEGCRRVPVQPEPMMRMPWKMPSAGDTVWFGFMSWIWERSPQFMWPEEIYWVAPREGEPYALGDWCIVEQIREKAVSESGLVLSATPGTEVGRGVVMAVGDGFSMQKPGIIPGMTVLFKSFGARNSEVRNPFGGENATRIRPSQVVAIDNEGISMEELHERKSQAESVTKDLSRLNNVGVLDIHDRESGERMAAEDIAKAQRKHDDVRYYGKRMKHH